MFATNAYRTHVEVHEAVRDKLLREDFAHRIDGLTFRLPNLAERVTEHRQLINHFFSAAQVEKKAARGLAEAVDPDLYEHLVDLCGRGAFTGNVRQLERFIQRLVAISPRGQRIGMPEYKAAFEFSLFPPQDTSLRPRFSPAAPFQPADASSSNEEDSASSSTKPSDAHPLDAVFMGRGWNDLMANKDRIQNSQMMASAEKVTKSVQTIVTYLVEEQREKDGGEVPLITANRELLDFSDDQEMLRELCKRYSKNKADWKRAAG